MSKVLGFRKKDAERYYKIVTPFGKDDLGLAECKLCKKAIQTKRGLLLHLRRTHGLVSSKEKRRFVPVVSVSWLEKYEMKNHQRHTVNLADDVWNFTKGYNKALNDLLSAVRKEARK